MSDRWNDAALDRLAAEFTKLEHEVRQMQSDELNELRRRVRAANDRPRAIFTAFGAPVLAAAIGSGITILAQHIH